MISLLVYLIAVSSSGIDDKKVVSMDWGLITHLVVLDGLEIKQGVTVGKFERTKALRGLTVIEFHGNQSYVRVGDLGLEIRFQVRVERRHDK